MDFAATSVSLDLTWGPQHDARKSLANWRPLWKPLLTNKNGTIAHIVRISPCKCWQAAFRFRSGVLGMKEVLAGLWQQAGGIMSIRCISLRWKSTQRNWCKTHVETIYIEAHWFLATRSPTHTRPPCNSPVHLAWRCLPPVTPSPLVPANQFCENRWEVWRQGHSKWQIPSSHWFWCLPICPIWSKSWYQKPNSIQVVSGNWSCLKVGCLIIILPIHFQAKPIELGDSL